MKSNLHGIRRAAAFSLALAALPASAALTNSTTVVDLPAAGGSVQSDLVAAWGGNPVLPGNLAAKANFTLLAGTYPFGGSVANLKDGLMVGSVSSPFNLDNTPNSVAFANGTNRSRFKVVLDGTYDLSRIDVFTSYQWTRTGQKWDVFTSANGGRTWSDTPLATVDHANTDAFPSSGWNSRRVSIFDHASAPVAVGVNALRFDIHQTDTRGGGQAEAVFSEVAVYGVPHGGAGSGISVQTATRLLPSGTVPTDGVILQSWGGQAIDEARNLAEDAAVTVPSGAMVFDSRAANINDGRLVSEIAADDGQYSLDNTSNSAVPAAGSEIVFALDGTRDLGKIEVFTSYQWPRAGQRYDIYTSTDGGANWSELATVDYPSENLHPESGWMTRRVTVEGSSHVLAKGVNAVKFVFPGNDPVEGGFPESVFNEIAIYPAVEKWVYKNGQRFFPIGISNYPDGTALKTLVSSSEEQIREVALAGVNWAWEMMNGARGEQLLDNEMLDRCGRHGISVSAITFNWNPDHSWLTQKAFHVPGSPFDLAVRDIMGNPHLLNYYGMDEAIVLVGINGWPKGHDGPYTPVDYDTLMSGKRFLKSIDPDRFIMYIEGAPDHCVANFGARETRRWVNNLTDVVGINYYPVRATHSFPSSDLLLLPSLYLDQMARLVDPDPKAEGFTRYNAGRPLIAAWQGGPSSPTGPRPRLEEMRANVYSLIIHGAKGLSSWGEGFLDLSKPEDVECWNNYKKVSRELADLQPVLVSDDVAYSFWQATPPPSVPDWRRVEAGGLQFGHPSVIGVVKEHNGDRYLIAMNWSNQDLGDVSMTVPGWKHANNENKTTVMFEDRSVDSASETWTDRFGPWEVHIYTDKQTVLRVEQPAGSELSSHAAATTFGHVPTATASAGRLYTVSNIGSAPLTGIALEKLGPHAGDFTVTPPAIGPLAPGASTTFTVSFAPSAGGARSAQLSIARGDTDTLPFVVNLSGFGLADDVDTDGDAMSDAAEAALSALGFDWQTAQPALVGALRDNAPRAGLFNREQFDASRVAGRAEVTGNPAAYGLYDSNSIMDLRMAGAFTMSQDGAFATVVIQPQTTADPAAQPFTGNGPPVTNVVSTAGTSGFFRIKASRQ